MGCSTSLPKEKVTIMNNEPESTKLQHLYIVSGFIRIHFKYLITSDIRQIIANFSEPERTPQSLLIDHYECQFCFEKVTNPYSKKRLYVYDGRQCSNKKCNAFVLTSATCDNDESIEWALDLFSIKITPKMRGYVWLWVVGLEKKGVFMRWQNELDLNHESEHDMFNVYQPIWFRQFNWKVIEKTVKNTLKSNGFPADINKQICDYIDFRKLQI
eukprot:168070_1